MSTVDDGGQPRPGRDVHPAVRHRGRLGGPRPGAASPARGSGWLARRDLVPLGYLGDAAKTARTFPVIDGVRYSVPGDRANVLADGRIELLGRDSVTINSGGEKIFAEEVERAIAAHPGVYDVVVVGRPSERWGSEVVAVVQLAEGATATDEELVEAAGRHIARYKIPKADHPHPEGRALARRQGRLPLGQGARGRGHQIRVAAEERRRPALGRFRWDRPARRPPRRAVHAP